MKILMLINSLDRGGAESHVITLAAALSARGHSVTVASTGGALASRLTSVNVADERIRLGRSPISLIHGYSDIRRLIKNGSFDVVHAHTRLSAFIGGYLAEKYGVRFVTTVHAIFSTRGLLRRLSRWGSTVIAVSEDLREYLCEKYDVSSENTYMVENGIDTDIFSCSHCNDEGKRRIVFVSRLDRDCSDAAYSLLRIAPLIFERFQDIEIVICGGGDVYMDLSEKAKKQKGIRLLGGIDNVETVLRGASVFVGVSRAALEAMSCGVPVVLYGNEGYFGPLKDESDLSLAALGNFCCRDMEDGSDERLLKDIFFCLSLNERERKKISDMLSEYIRKNHSSEKMAERTEAVYRAMSVPDFHERGEVVLCGYYGYGNMGDNALLRNAIRIARQKFNGRRISALTRHPRQDKRAFNIRCVFRMNPISVLIELSGASVFVFGGGTLLQENTSLRSLIYYTTLIRLASAMGTRVELWGNGIDRPKSRFGAMLLRSALSECSIIGLRDRFSIIECKKAISGEDKKVFLQKDLALSQKMCENTRSEYLKRRLRITNRPYAVISVCGGRGDGYRSILSYWLRDLEEKGIRLLFVPMFPRVDLEETKKLCDEFGGVMTKNISESDMVGLIKDATVVYGMRLHSLVFAASAGIPFVGFGADVKVERFCRENGGTYFTDLY